MHRYTDSLRATAVSIDTVGVQRKIEAAIRRHLRTLGADEGSKQHEPQRAGLFGQTVPTGHLMPRTSDSCFGASKLRTLTAPLITQALLPNHCHPQAFVVVVISCLLAACRKSL